MNGAVNLDVNVVADVKGPEIGGEGNGSLLPEWAREGVSRARSQSMSGRHILYC